MRAEITTNWERKVDYRQALTNSDLLHGVLMELRHLREEMAGLHNRLDSQAQIKQEKGPDCSVCWGSLRPPLEIMQCAGGHVFCGGCYDRLEENKCTVCQERMAGRASGLENYLKINVS